MSTMTTEQYTHEFEARFDQFIDSLRALHDSKRRAYTGGRRPLENYEAAAATLTKMGAREDRGCLTIMVGRLQEKVNRIASLVGMDDFMTAERDESFEDTCMDIAVIAGLCVAERALLEAEKLPVDFRMNDEERAMFSEPEYGDIDKERNECHCMDCEQARRGGEDFIPPCRCEFGPPSSPSDFCRDPLCVRRPRS